METLWWRMNYWGQDVFIDSSRLKFYRRYLLGRHRRDGRLLLALGDPALGDHVELLGPLVDGVVAGVVELGVGPHLLQVPHAGGEVCVEAVVQPRLDRGQVHRLGHHLQQVRLHLTGTIRPQ